MEGDAFHDEQQYQEALDEWDFVEAQGGKQLATLQSGDSYSRVLSQRLITDFIQIVEGPRCAAILEANELSLFSKIRRYIFGPPLLEKRCREKLASILSLTKLSLGALPEETQYEVLATLYENLTTEPCPRRYGSHWQKIGFQGNDPATDLRGVGVFGLWLLLRLSEDSVVKKSFSQSCTKSPDSYPFCTCMMTLCKATMTLAKEGALNKYIEEKTIEDVTYHVFRQIFISFECEYSKSEEKGVLAAGEISRKIDKNPKKYVRISSILVSPV
ncbi:Oidioi.mRNA.OKI2018_I69.XSR.g13813.t1.cds [Oikopleura dioica]|uniref:Oidioi.mRNA.OKI2018_I69.XSR.g13813.t1.cds n=1 Tax=Oikopleura dioica TaxID=34765 RepID=A0ABN7SBY4_OIKDI|nr:Oidioi.mRNA.OKI2018_I69.XSR.g13813.t1.cds [Oikopleura dioica]